MCFDIDRFIDQEAANDLMCSICRDVLCCPQSNKSRPISKQEPLKGTERGHKFCENCILTWLKQNESCPDCREPLNTKDLQPLDRYASNSLKRLRVRCKYYIGGCDYVDKLELIEEHELNNCAIGAKRRRRLTLKIQNSEINSEIDSEIMELLKEKDNEIQDKDKDIESLHASIKELNFQLSVKDSEIIKLNIEKSQEQDKLNVTVNRLENQVNLLTEQCEKLKKENENKQVSIDLMKHLKHRTNLEMHTMLHLSILNGNLNEVKQLIEQNKVNVNHKDKDGYTALMKASRSGYLDLVKLLIENQANVDEKNIDNNTALIYASWNGHLNVVESLIQNGALVNHKSNNGNTALIYASWNGHTDVVKALIENGAVVNEKDKDGWTALVYASQKGHSNIIKLLTKNDAKRTHKHNKNRTSTLCASTELDVIKL